MDDHIIQCLCWLFKMQLPFNVSLALKCSGGYMVETVDDNMLIYMPTIYICWQNCHCRFVLSYWYLWRYVKLQWWIASCLVGSEWLWVNWVLIQEWVSAVMWARYSTLLLWWKRSWSKSFWFASWFTFQFAFHWSFFFFFQEHPTSRRPWRDHISHLAWEWRDSQEKPSVAMEKDVWTTII